MNNQKKAVRISARISPELYKRVKEHGKKRELSLSHLVSQGLQKVVNKK